jgi:hypothetical protein
MGGTWISTNPKLAPLLWREHFPPTISAQLVSSSNTTGTLTNSDLEQLALVCHPDVLASEYGIREHTISTLSDNTAAVSREQRGSTTTSAAAAYLCRIASIHQRSHRYRHRVAYIPGPLNVMADDLSRRWDLSDSQLLHYFDLTYPQALPWKLCPLRHELNLATTLALSKKRCAPESLAADTWQLTHTGTNGSSSVNNMNWRPTSAKDPMQSAGSRFSLNEYATVGFLPPTTTFELERWQMPMPLLRRRTQWLASQTHV